MSSSQKDTRIKDNGSMACKIRFNLMDGAFLLVYIVLIILFTLKYRIVATLFMVGFMTVLKLSKIYCPQTYWKFDFYGYALPLMLYMIMYIGMLASSWLPFDNPILRVITNALAPIGTLYLVNHVPGLATVVVLPLKPFA